MNAYRSNKENQFLDGKIAGISILLALITALPAYGITCQCSVL